jgi:Family of unknown function (DUF5670)
MLWTIIVILVVLWLLGFIGHIGGGLIHLLIVIAVIVLVVQLIQGRRLWAKSVFAPAVSVAALGLHSANSVLGSMGIMREPLLPNSRRDRSRPSPALT